MIRLNNKTTGRAYLMSSSSEQDFARYLGTHRVIEPRGTLPQPAWKLDNTPSAYPTETLIYVQKLHIDSASFTQIARMCELDTERMGQHIMDIVTQRGKMHNPVTGRVKDRKSTRLNSSHTVISYAVF